MNDLDQKIKTTLVTFAEKIDIPDFDLHVKNNSIPIQPKQHFLLRRFSVLTLCAVLLLSAASAFAKDDLMKIITEFTSSKGGGNLVGVSFIGGKSSAAFEGDTIASINTSEYTNELQQMIGISFPKLRINNLLLNNIHAELINREEQQFLVSSGGQIPDKQSKIAVKDVTLTIYHNLTKEFKVDGSTNNSPEVNQIDINGTKTTYVKVDSGGISLLTWKRNQWTIVLSGTDIPEDSLLKIAADVDHQASNPTS
jgi:hypothetical protein